MSASSDNGYSFNVDSDYVDSSWNYGNAKSIHFFISSWFTHALVLKIIQHSPIRLNVFAVSLDFLVM